MNREETKEAIKVMQHYADGGAIQLSRKNANDWTDVDFKPRWDWMTRDYRIKPTPKLRPYTFEELCEAVKKHGIVVRDNESQVYTIVYFNEAHIRFSGDCKENYTEFFVNNVWLDDGSPCGVMEEE